MVGVRRAGPVRRLRTAGQRRKRDGRLERVRAHRDHLGAGPPLLRGHHSARAVS
uniref:Uncharacterized protein n=1 Tax=uncultured marine virus TaxID=186617 RepID=A0A0F7L6V9_9VIRU|nr:hypothetical protein [uncultured marine virus]